jgi:DHA2 family multidrug resistance protein
MNDNSPVADSNHPALTTESPIKDVNQVAEKPSWWRWAIVLTACLGAIMEVIDTSIVNVALPHIQATLGVTISEVAWTITGYAMANVVMIPLSAWLGEVFGKKNYFIFCLIGFTLSSVLCGMAGTLPILVASRMLQGLTGGGLLAKAQGIIFETFRTKKEQGMAQGIFGMGVMVGPALGPVLGGYLTDALGWRWIFFINIPFGVLAVICATVFFVQDRIKGEKHENIPVDWFGIFFLIMGLGGLQVMLEEGNREQWFQSPLIITMAITAFVGAVLFVWRELTAAHPAVDLYVLRHKALVAGSIFSVVLGVGLYGSVFAIPIFAQTVLGMDATQTGLLLLPSALASGAFMIISTILAQKFDARWIVLAGALLLSFALFQLSNITTETGADNLFWPNILRGLGTVLMFMPLTLATMSAIPAKEIHSATGFFNLTRQIGGSIGIAALTTLLDQRQTYHHSVLVEHVSRYEPGIRQFLGGMSQRFMGEGSTVANMKAEQLLEGMTSIQALVMSYSDIFWSVGMLFIVCCSLIFFLGSGRQDPNVKIEMH